MEYLKSGVKKYIKATATVTVFFPVDFRDNVECNCYQCKYFSRNSGVCLLTKEISEYPQRYIGSHCPLNIIEEVEKENGNEF